MAPETGQRHTSRTRRTCNTMNQYRDKPTGSWHILFCCQIWKTIAVLQSGVTVSILLGFSISKYVPSG